MSNLENGIIALLSFDMDSIRRGDLSLKSSRKALDFKITSNFPIISFDNDRKITILDRTRGVTRDVTIQHFSVPQNLHIHVTTKKKEHIYFDTQLIDKEKKELNQDVARLFTWFSGPIASCKPLMPISRHGAALITMIPGVRHTERTGVFADFFIHKQSTSPEEIFRSEFQDASCYMITDHHSSMLGPLSLHFGDLFRKDPHNKVMDAYMTIRYGFYETDDGSQKMDIPFKIFIEP